jgi:hypothetical protein
MAGRQAAFLHVGRLVGAAVRGARGGAEQRKK